MKKYFLFLNVLLVFFLTWSHIAVAKPKYRYIKREHGVKFHFNLNDHITVSPFYIPLNIGLGYTYNWKGMIEFGPYFEVKADIEQGSFILPSLAGGLVVEYNIIKNKGKRKTIPAIGLDFGFHKGEINKQLADQRFYLLGGPYGALKMFVGKRTPLTINLGYKLYKPMGVSGFYHGVKFSVGFSYYFDLK